MIALDAATNPIMFFMHRLRMLKFTVFSNISTETTCRNFTAFLNFTATKTLKMYSLHNKDAYTKFRKGFDVRFLRYID